MVEYFSNIQNKIMKNSSRFSPNLHTNKNSPLLPNPNTHTEKKERKKMGEIYLFTILPIKKLLTVTEPPPPVSSHCTYKHLSPLTLPST